MQYNCPFIPNPYLNVAPQQFGQQYIQPCIPSYTIPPQDVPGRGEVLSVQYPDGSTQFYFVPARAQSGCASCGPWRPPAAYRVDRVSTPIPATLFHQHYPFPVPFFERGNTIPEFTIQPPAPPHKVQFHNDAWTSTTDLHYFYPNLRGKPWIPKVDAQVETPREQNDTPKVPEHNRPPCLCRPKKRRSEAIQTKPHLRDASVDGIKTRSKSKSVNITAPEPMSEDGQTSSEPDKKRKNNRRRKIIYRSPTRRPSKDTRKRKRRSRKYLRSGSSNGNSSDSESYECPCSSGNECDPECQGVPKKRKQDSKNTKKPEVPQTDTSCKLDPNSCYEQGQKWTWHDSRRGVSEQNALKIVDSEEKVKEHNAMAINGKEMAEIQELNPKAVMVDSETTPIIEEKAKETIENNIDSESRKICTCPGAKSKMLSFRPRKLNNATITIDVETNLKPKNDSVKGQNNEENKCPSNQRCLAQNKDSKSKNSHQITAPSNSKKLPLGIGKINIEIANGSGTKIATQSVQQTDGLYSHSMQGVDLPAPSCLSKPSIDQPGPSNVQKPCIQHYQDTEALRDDVKKPGKDASSGGFCGALPWVLLEKLESVTSSVDKFLDMMQCACDKQNDGHPLPTNGIF
ncbi:hypothetical protein JYU34_015898 [Plutella xylostella]|uniref:Uncharacterized protein n=1 Tax=Plutella xylostella TaxID=51655 RepID=A0ABQ7Q585_PLUXY|nr:hypothetical protein JYU34_015898 [Plutella xylostella]